MTSTNGIAGLYLGTHDWDATIAFWQGLGFRLTFETGHSGMLVHPAGGPYLFVDERPADEATELHPIIDVPDADAFTPPPHGEVVEPFAPTHWHTRQMVVRDPDGRQLSLQAPPDGGAGDWPGSGG